MGLPAKRRTKQSKRERAAHFALKAITLSVCPKCKHAVKPHRICQNCGYYRSRDILKLASRDARKTKRKQKKDKKSE
ncbi:50S ribosomal protein L32 [Candidatus Parcubacteria bacterium]|jgi:large subunit ribosomal protein L32|nr:MAG: 50S ribosomal protein L32 [Candidatus Parcubacteria bacterium]